MKPITDAELASLPRAALPRVFPVKQRFQGPQLSDVEGAVLRELKKIFPNREGFRKKTIGVTAVSRGIQGQDLILKTTIDFLKGFFADVVIIPAVGSHGGGTAIGRRKLLASLGITEKTMGVKIHAGIETRLIDTLDGMKVYCSKAALDVDVVLLVNRIKEHTDITWEDDEILPAKTQLRTLPHKGRHWGLQSGLTKAALIGLSNRRAADVHRVAVSCGLGQAIEQGARRLFGGNELNVVGGLAIVENAYHQTALIKGIKLRSPDQFFKEERLILDESLTYLPHLPWKDGLYDVVWVQEAGKSISGQGVHTKTVGRGPNGYLRGKPWQPGMPSIYTLLGSSLVGHNSNGMGLFDFITERYYQTIHGGPTITNALSAGFANGAKMPWVLKNDEAMLQIALKSSSIGPYGYRVAFIRNTNDMEIVWLSEALQESANTLDHVEVLGDPRKIEFDPKGHFNMSFSNANLV